MTKYFGVIAAVFSLLVIPSMAIAKDKPLTEAQIKEKVNAAFPRATFEKLEKAPIEGFYQILSQGEVFYVSDDGKHMMFGKLISIDDGIKDLTSARIAQYNKEQRPARVDAIKALKNEDFVLFKAKNEKHRVTVFTDVDCGYCRKLHRDVPQLNEMGISVQYLAFPRAGIPSESYNKLVSIWCSDNQQDAMDKAKLKRQFDYKTCETSIKDKHMPLVREFGLRGTPAIVTASGEVLPGYLPPEELMQRVANSEKN